MHRLSHYIQSFSVQLADIHPASLRLAPYPAEYLLHLLKQRTYYLHLYAQVLETILQLSPHPKENMVLLDYGAGNGLLGMFAKHCGFKTVVSIDINPQFVAAASLLNRQLARPVDTLLTGDLPAAADFFSTHPPPHAVAGTDVIEHIYDLHRFLSGLKALNSSIIPVFTTASVTSNPFKSYQLKKLQRQDEYTASNPAHTLTGNPHAGLSFLEARKRIIQQQASLSEKETAMLAQATRGMMLQDIIQATARYIQSGQVPLPMAHSTNTCDPYTGNWTERLLTVAEYRRLFGLSGFDLQVSTGFYNQWQPGFKSILLSIFNRLIATSPAAGRKLTPYILLAGK